MLIIAASCFRADVRFIPSVLRGLLGSWLSNACVRPAAACVAAYSEDVLGNGRVSGKNFVVLET